MGLRSVSAPKWCSILRHCISVLEASLQTLVRSRAVSQPAVIGSPIGWFVNNEKALGKKPQIFQSILSRPFKMLLFIVYFWLMTRILIKGRILIKFNEMGGNQLLFYVSKFEIHRRKRHISPSMCTVPHGWIGCASVFTWLTCIWHLRLLSTSRRKEPESSHLNCV